jgi:hypothetical protein
MSEKIKKFEKYVNDEKIKFSIKIISKEEAQLKFNSNIDSNIDRMLDDMDIWDEMSDILNSDEISGNFGKYKFEYENVKQIDNIIKFLIKKGFIYDKLIKKINNTLYCIELEKMTNNKYSFYTSSKKNVVTTNDYVKNGKILEELLKSYIDYDDDNYILINEMENFHIIVFDNNIFLNKVIDLIKSKLKVV